MNKDQVQGQFEQVKGKMKQGIGKATGVGGTAGVERSPGGQSHVATGAPYLHVTAKTLRGRQDSWWRPRMAAAKEVQVRVSDGHAACRVAGQETL